MLIAAYVLKVMTKCSLRKMRARTFIQAFASVAQREHQSRKQSRQPGAAHVTHHSAKGWRVSAPNTCASAAPQIDQEHREHKPAAEMAAISSTRSGVGCTRLLDGNSTIKVFLSLVFIQDRRDCLFQRWYITLNNRPDLLQIKAQIVMH